jgi:hypothetical protein
MGLCSAAAADGPVDATGGLRRCGRDADAVGGHTVAVERLQQHQQVLLLVGAATGQLGWHDHRGRWHGAQCQRVEREGDGIARVVTVLAECVGGAGAGA